MYTGRYVLDNKDDLLFMFYENLFIYKESVNPKNRDRIDKTTFNVEAHKYFKPKLFKELTSKERDVLHTSLLNSVNIISEGLLFNADKINKS